MSSVVFGCDPGMKSIQEFQENYSELTIPSVQTGRRNDVEEPCGGEGNSEDVWLGFASIDNEDYFVVPKRVVLEKNEKADQRIGGIGSKPAIRKHMKTEELVFWKIRSRAWQRKLYASAFTMAPF